MRSVPYTEFYAPLAELLGSVEAEIARLWETESGFLNLAVRRTLSGRGKRLRPVLTLLTAECVGGATARTRRFAAVAEVVHAASLVHDDVVDGALSRRGRRSAKAAWGNKISVLLGDYLIARAFIRLEEEDAEQLALELAKVARQMCDGQILELRLTGRLISEEQYFRIVRAKTASLFGLCGKAGVVTAGGPAELAAAFQEFGEHFGLAFQIADDILDLVGSNGRSGKSQGRDLAERKMTLPLILAARAEPDVRARIRTLLSAAKAGAGGLRLAQQFVRSTRALEQSWEAVHGSLARARASLAAAPDSEAKQALLSLAGAHFPLPVMQ